jgi:hypothetical protein
MVFERIRCVKIATVHLQALEKRRLDAPRAQLISCGLWHENHQVNCGGVGPQAHVQVRLLKLR